MRRLLLPFACAALAAAPTWKAPAKLRLGALEVLELAETDPTKPSLPRPPVEERMGPLTVRAVEPAADGRGWRLTVQAFQTGPAQLPELDLGDGRRAPALRLEVPRTVPLGAPWEDFGGALPDAPFPWAFALGLTLPLLLPGAWLLRRWIQGGARRRLRQARRAFRHAWPPKAREREVLDAAHAAGRALLAARWGESARAWGEAELRQRELGPWAQWAASLDAARFGRTEPPFPERDVLEKALEVRK